MSVTGDFKKAELLARGLQLAGHRGAQVFTHYAGEEMLKLTRGQGRRAESPDGKPWAPLVLRNRELRELQRRAERADRLGKSLRYTPRKPLRGITESARARFGVVADGATAVVDLPKKGAFFSQRGTRHQVQRLIVPRTQDALPPRWRSRIQTRAAFMVWREVRAMGLA